MSRPRAILFDLDGTLIDSIELILNSARFAFDKHGFGWPGDQVWLAGVGTPLPAMFGGYVTETVDLPALIAAYREYQLANHDRLVRCYDAVVDTLDELRRREHPMGVVTSKTVELARRGLSLGGILDHFDVVIGMDSTERHKPHPEPVLTALDRLGYDPNEAAFVGDSVHDIEAGNAAGVATIAALWGPFTRDQLATARPTHFLERIRELPSLVGYSNQSPARGI